MKKNILLILLAFGGLNLVFAQPVFNAADLNPVPGDAYYARAGEAPANAQGSGGANQTWDFSTFQDTSDIDSLVYGVPTGFAGSAAFPAATIAEGMEDFYEATSSVFSYLGSTSSFGNIIYTDPQDIYRYPVSVGQTWSDVYAYTDSSNNEAYSGRVTFEADGYGTVITPNGTYNDVVRIHYVDRVIQDNVGATDSTTIEQWLWVKADIPYPVFGLINFEFFGFTFNTFYTIVSVSVDRDQAMLDAMRIYPNPAQDVLRVFHPQLGARALNLRLRDLQGRLLGEKQLRGAAGVQEAEMNVADLPAGLYLLEMQVGETVATRKVVVN